MNTYKVTLKAYGMTQIRYLSAPSAADAKRQANNMTSIGRVVRVAPVEQDGAE